MSGRFRVVDEPLVWRADASLSCRDLLYAAANVAALLPARRYLVNLCESREEFLVAFVASIIARQIQLMPGARTPLAIAELTSRYADSHCVTDQTVRDWRAAGNAAPLAGLAPIEPKRLMLTGFTSGSTGASQAHDKLWNALLASVTLNAAAIRAAAGLGEDAQASIVGTVPAHHMYGIELTVLLPLLGGMSVHSDRPLFPADVAAALASTAGPRILVSTPLHLRALAEADVDFPELALIVSATAPLDQSLASRIEARLRAPLLEMFGSTETCVFATRQTAREPEWRLYDGVEIVPEDESTRVSAAWFERDQALQDLLETRGQRTFVLRGRNSDMVEVAGKRASLADITRRICAVPGVEDAVAFQPDGAAGAANRVAAAVVSRGATERQIAAELAAALDAVFLPRPLMLVDRIPRDSVGKVSRAMLLALASSHSA
jgi:acyl-coenzyme A synthetase/AMP-(fatty) acid ligase